MHHCLASRTVPDPIRTSNFRTEFQRRIIETIFSTNEQTTAEIRTTLVELCGFNQRNRRVCLEGGLRRMQSRLSDIRGCRELHDERKSNVKKGVVVAYRCSRCQGTCRCCTRPQCSCRSRRTGNKNCKMQQSELQGAFLPKRTASLVLKQMSHSLYVQAVVKPMSHDTLTAKGVLIEEVAEIALVTLAIRALQHSIIEKKQDRQVTATHFGVEQPSVHAM